MNQKTSLLYIGYFCAIFCGYIIAFSFYNERSPDLFWGFTTTISPALELMFFCMVGLGLARFGRGYVRIPFLMIALLIPLGVALIYVAQGYSVILSGAYLTVLALENQGETQYITGPGILSVGAFVIGTWVCLVWVVLRGTAPHRVQPMTVKKWIGVGVLSILFVGVFDGKSRPTDIVYFAPDAVPTVSLIRKGVALRAARQNVANSLEELVTAGLPSAVTVRTGAQYPIQRTQSAWENPPFAQTSGPQTPLNVIIVFAEGFSGRLMDTYGGPYPDLTPNLNAFAKDVTVVDNYYNHSAATFRGLLGQLASGYPYYGGFMKGGWTETGKDNTATLTSVGYQTLSNVLGERGYDTVFFSPHPNTNPLNTMLRALDFQTVHSLETMGSVLKEPIVPHPGVASGGVEDRDLFASLRQMLEDRKDQSTPFFAATYNIGTHAFLDVSERAVRYGDGSNAALNRFHEFDTAIGPFLDYFMQSSYAQNTLLIITTDHASYHEPPVVEAFDAPDFYRFFVDQVPMLIHAPHLQMPARYDAHYENSIDLAPSVLHLLGVDDYDHAFLGQSIFDPNRLDGFSVASIGVEDYLITADGIFRQSIEDAPEHFRPQHNLVKLFQFLERQNRLFGDDQTR